MYSSLIRKKTGLERSSTFFHFISSALDAEKYTNLIFQQVTTDQNLKEFKNSL